MFDGSVGYALDTWNNGKITMFGGTISGEIVLGDQSSVVINGSNFGIDGVSFNSGEISSILGGFWNNEPYRRLTCTLANGDILNNRFKIGNSASITLVNNVPEPSTMALLITGLIASGLYLLHRK
jgi:hypothetical protein